MTKTMKAMMTEIMTTTATSGHFHVESHPPGRKGEGGDGKTMKAMMTEMVTMTATSGHFQEESHPSERKGEEGIAEGGGGGEKGVPHPFTQKGAVDGGENGAPLPLRCSPIHPSARQ